MFQDRHIAKTHKKVTLSGKYLKLVPCCQCKIPWALLAREQLMVEDGCGCIRPFGRTRIFDKKQFQFSEVFDISKTLGNSSLLFRPRSNTTKHIFTGIGMISRLPEFFCVLQFNKHILHMHLMGQMSTSYHSILYKCQIYAILRHLFC